MKKTFNVVLPIFIMIAIAVVCVCIYMAFTNRLPNFNSFESDLDVSTEKVEGSIVLSKKECPTLDAFANLQPLVTAVVKDFAQDSSVSDSSLNYSEANKGYDRLLSGEVDILFATAPSDDVLTRANAMGIELELIPIAKDGFVFYVNSNNPVDSLKVSDVQKIYSGQVSNWSQVGGENLDITAFQRPENSLNQKEMISLVMRNLEMVNPPKSVFRDKQFGEINDLIASYDNSRSAIGYSYYYDAKVLYDIDVKTENVIKLLKINDVEPSYDNIFDGSYPLQTTYYMVRNKSNTHENVQIFIDAMLSDRGKNVVKEAGYIEN